MKNYFLFIVVLFIGLNDAYATHNRAGEITYKYIGDSDHPYKYRITVTTYTNIINTNADRCEDTIYFGDGDHGIAPRINGPNTLGCASGHDGVIISFNTKLNIYEIDHNYVGPGNYSITMDDQNRNAGICNIPNSVNQSFTLITQLSINPFLGFNNSPILLNPPIDDACVNECFIHNPGAYDIDGDSLSYSLTTCYANGTPIFGYSLPPTTNNPIAIDPLKGDLLWCAPPSICQYNVAILIKEYRLLPGSPKRYYIGSILRDMQINVVACQNDPPRINDINDTCIVAGTTLNFNVKATDPQVDVVTLDATGGPFEIVPSATFNSSPAVSPVTGTFHWTPDCTEIQLLPYLVTFKATDSDPVSPLVDFESVFIRVVAPAPMGLTATPNGASMILNWNAAFCGSTTNNNPLKGYLVYRKNTCEPWVHNPCETGVPSYTGYTLIGATDATITTFTDNNKGQGLIHGVNYSYIVVAFYNDGSQSYASGNVCSSLVRDVPIITNVSVLSTDAATGSIWTHWVKPLATANNLDTIANPPPYEYRLMQGKGFNGSVSFSQVSSYSYASYSELTDTGFVSTGLNTQGTPYTYRVDLYSNGILKGSTHTASSVFLSSSATDNKVNLSWKEFVPWANYQYDVYRETAPGSTIFTIIGSTTNKSYIDSGLVNGQNYCYKISSIGEYSDPALPHPLYNWSERKCETPIDQTPPCQPNFNVSGGCDLGENSTFQNIITWTNPNTYCSNDVVKYRIWYSRTTDGTMEIIYESSDMSTTTFTHVDNYDNVPSLAGCYAVTAVDSFANESAIVKKICVDNCPEYELPNVFTPNGDGTNDLFKPLIPYRYVKDIDIKIFDRWGLLMFKTTNPDILWDGKNSSTKQLCSDGTYFYICTVNEIRVDGIKPRVLKGFVELIQTTKP